MTYTWYDVLGNLGVGMIVVTYFLLQIRRTDIDSFAYSFWNALGASLIILSLIVDFNLSAMVVEVFWLCISLLGMVRLALARRGEASR